MKTLIIDILLSVHQESITRKIEILLFDEVYYVELIVIL